MRLGPMARHVLLAGLCALACLAPVATMATPPTHQYFRVENPNNAVATRVVYFFSSAGQPQVCQPKTPLTYRNLPVYKVSGNATFNIRTWTGSGGVAYTVSAEAGVLTSTQPGGNPC